MRLKSFREAASLTIEKTAEYLGVSDRSVIRWEQGHARLPVHVVAKMAKLFGVSQEAILKAATEAAS